MFRKMLSWEWYQDANTARLFIHLLLTANIHDTRFMGVIVPKGSRVSSIPTLAKELHLSNRQIRTGLEHLQMTGEVTRTAYPKFSVISIVKWEDYQTERQAKRQATDRQVDSQATGDRQQNKKIEEYKEEKNKADGTLPSEGEWPPPKGTPEYERWRNQ